MQSGSHAIAIEIFALAKGKEPANDALPKFAAVFSELKRVGHVVKDVPSGKFAEDWNKAADALSQKPEMVDITLAISAVLAVKDEEELVRLDLCSLLLQSNASPRNSFARQPTLRRRS